MSAEAEKSKSVSRRITNDGEYRILWDKLPSGEWVELRRTKLRRSAN